MLEVAPQMRRFVAGVLSSVGRGHSPHRMAPWILPQHYGNTPGQALLSMQGEPQLRGDSPASPKLDALLVGLSDLQNEVSVPLSAGA